MLINGKTGNRNKTEKLISFSVQKPKIPRFPSVIETQHNTIFAKHNSKFSSSVFGFGHVYSRSIKVLDYYDKTGAMITEINCTNWRHHINVSYSAYWRQDRHFTWSSDECPCFRFPCFNMESELQSRINKDVVVPSDL